MNKVFKPEETTMGKLLASRQALQVPPHQRHYAWESEQVDRLWKDIRKTIEENRPMHFVGTILLLEDETHGLQIIDGQQRLATTSILISVLRDLYVDADLAFQDRNAATNVQWTYLAEYDSSKEHCRPYLVLSPLDDEEVYERLIIPYRPESDLKTNIAEARASTKFKSTRHLLSAYLRLHSLVKGYVEERGRQKQALTDIEKCISEKLSIVKIVAKQPVNPYRIFETLNQRGKKLNLADLVKNLTFSLTNGAQLKHAERQWNQMLSSLGNQDIEVFLRHYWIARYGEAKTYRKKYLYGYIEDQIDSEQIRPLELISDLCETAKTYHAFTEPQSDYWNRFSASVKRWLAELSLFRTNQCYPVLLAVLERYPAEYNKFLRAVQMLAIFSFRYSVVAGKSPGILEKIYAQICADIRSQKKKNSAQAFAAAIFEHLKKEYPSDKDFIRDFQKLQFPSRRKALARHLLAQIENHLQRRSERVADSDHLTLEHIYPQKPNEDWTKEWSAYREQETDYRYRMGNLTLLLSDPGKQAANRHISYKGPEIYAKSELKITRSLAKYKSWGPKEIDARQEKLAREACEVWRVEY